MNPLAIHIHHHFHGFAGGYVGLAAAALVSWAGLPGPGEAAVVAAAIVAVHGRLDIAEVVLIAWAGATVGGIAGWLAGLNAGRALVTTGTFMRRPRARALARGERFYARYGPVAVFVTPSWMAGIAGMRPSRYLPANLASALVWALAFGAGTYLVGPEVSHLAHALGTVGIVIVVTVLVAGAIGERFRRRSRSR